MPGTISRPKRSARGRPAAAVKSTTGLSNFVRVSKLPTLGKDIDDKIAALKAGRTSTIEIVLTSKKRSATDETEDSSRTDTSRKKIRREAEPTPVLPIAPATGKKKTVKFAEPEAAKNTPSFAAPTVSSSRKRRLEADSATPEPETLLERLNLSSPIRKRTKATIQPKNDFDLPQELVDLLDLHVALLKTLSMTIAHSGNNSPIELSTIYTSISQAWGKRQVALDDIRICIGILGWTPVKADKTSCRFFLCDYGRGKIYIERNPDAGSGPLREKKLNMDFEANLRTLWLGRRDQNIRLFIATLPRAAVKSCTVMHPITAKGQRTLMELKNGVVRKPHHGEEAKAVPLLKADGSEMSLLERIRHKDRIRREEAAKGPTPAELARRAALQRAEDIAAVIGMLCMATSTGQARISFTMAALMTKIKDSLRNPISHEDGVICVKLLATEIAPQWMRVVTVGGRENVVLQTAMQPNKAVLQERVNTLLA